jgi:hypothetical protein
MQEDLLKQADEGASAILCKRLAGVVYDSSLVRESPVRSSRRIRPSRKPYWQNGAQGARAGGFCAAQRTLRASTVLARTAIFDGRRSWVERLISFVGFELIAVRRLLSCGPRRPCRDG